jgi:virginiamycin B lyase
MKLAVAVCFALVLAACSSAGNPGGQPMPGTAQQSFAKRPVKLTVTGYYPVPSMGAVDVVGLTNGPGHCIWFTEFAGDVIGKMTTDGVVTTYLTIANAQPIGIAVSHSHKRVWAGGYGGTMIATTSGGVQKDYPIAGSHIGNVLLGPDKNIWFTDYGNDKFGRISAAGVVTEFALPARSDPGGMAVGSDGNFWITDSAHQKIIKESTSGVALASYGRNLSANETVGSIIAAPDGNLYFTETADNITIPDKIGRITIKGKIIEIGTLPPNASPNNLAVGKDKNVYFSMSNLQAVGTIALPTGKVTFQYLPLTRDNGGNVIINGPDDRLYIGGSNTIYAVSY